MPTAHKLASPWDYFAMLHISNIYRSPVKELIKNKL